MSLTTHKQVGKILRMKIKLLYSLAIALFLNGCASTVHIKSLPGHAKLYIDDSFKGETPYTYSSQKIIGSSTSITLKKEGFEPKHAVITRNAKLNIGALIGGIFFLFPLLWVMDYEHDITYELEPIKGGTKTK